MHDEYGALKFLGFCSATLHLLVYRKWAYSQALAKCEELCKSENKRLWLILSNRDGTKLNHKAAYKYLLKRQLASKICDGNAKVRLSRAEIDALSVYIRGHMAGDALVVSKSLIENAGNGLFAAKRLAKAELLCVYRGTKLSLAQTLKLQISEKDYLMGGFGLNVHVDASNHPNVLARYINDNFDKSQINVAFRKIERDACALVYTLRAIEPGEELYVSYGESYWRGRSTSLNASICRRE